MPKLKIDGRELEVPKGTTLLQAAERLGLEVPQMCYHPGLKIVGVCRVCLCQVKGWPKMTPACATEAGEGMEVGLYTPEAEKARRAVIEFWLLNHPLDCPVCDQGGECPLQDIAFDHGPGESRLHDAKLRKDKRVHLGPHVILDEERCILCWRCTRFTQDISGSNQIMLKDRGVYTTVGTAPGQVFDDPFSGNVVDLCPVGALTSADFRFKSRVWEMASTEGVCTACSVGCNTYVWSKKGVVERLTARPNLEVNDYWLCDRGRFDVAFAGSPRRLRLPRLRVNGRLIDVEWEDAVKALAEGLGPSAGKGQHPVAALLAPHLANEEYWSFQKFMRSGLGSNHIAVGRVELLTPARIDLMKRGRTLRAVTEIEHVDGILVVGGDLESTHPVHGLRVRKAVRDRGVRLFLASPNPTRLDGEAVLSERVAAAQVVPWLTVLAEKLRQGASDRWVSELRRVSRLAVLVNAGEHNPQVVEAIEAFLGSGSKDASWKTLILDEGGNAAGAALLGAASHYFPGFRPVTPDEAQVWKTRWGGRVSGQPGLDWNGIVGAARSRKLAGLLLVNSGRPAGWKFTDAERAALGEVPFVAAFDLFEEEVGSFAHLVLPSPTFAEIDATYTTADGLVQLSRRNVVPEVPSTLQVLGKAAAILGVKLKGPQPIEIFREITRDVPQFAGLDFGKASRGGARGELAPVPAGAGSR